LAGALQIAGLCKSSSEGRRLVQGGGVRVDRVVVKDPEAWLQPGTRLLQVGKSKAARVVVPSA
jgi:tyrosyl-tRNA synthetase